MQRLPRNTQKLIDAISAYMRATGKAKTVIGKEAVGTPNIVLYIERGQEIRNKTQTNLINWMKDNPPSKDYKGDRPWEQL